MEQSSPDSYSTPVTVANTKNATLDKWLLVLMIFFIIMALVMGILYALIAPQQTVFLNNEPKLYSFSQIYGKALKNEGKDSIQCGNGKKVTIVDAQFYVYDAYRQCYPTGDLAFTPDVSDFDNVESDANPNRNCGPYWTGGKDTGGTGKPAASGFTGEATNGSSGDIGCKFDNSGVFAGTGRSCWGGDYQCTWKNITQYIATECDGKSTCPMTVNESIGPSPCNILMDLDAKKDEFINLPHSVVVENGNSGSTPGGEYGLYVTGTYMCSV